LFGHNLTMLHGGLAGGPGYLSLLDDDEVLADLSRGHPDKSSTQLVYPCLDLEVHGRSGQSRLGGRGRGRGVRRGLPPAP
jgi:hypothetical protein